MLTLTQRKALTILSNTSMFKPMRVGEFARQRKEGITVNKTNTIKF